VGVAMRTNLAPFADFHHVELAGTLQLGNPSTWHLSATMRSKGKEPRLTLHLVLAAFMSIAAFAAVIAMSNRKLGANIAWAILLAGGVIAFVANAAGPFAGMSPRQIAGFAAGLLAAGAAGMLYHFFLGRFTKVWNARGVLTLAFLGFWLAFGFAIQEMSD
jgi:hypothetical protein